MSCGRRPAPRNVVKWDVGRPAPRPPRTFALMRSPADCVVGGGVPDAPRRGQDPSLRCKGYGVVMARLRAGHARPLQTAANGSRMKARPTECGKAGCRAACPQAAADVCGNEKPCGLCCRGRRPRRPAEGSRPLPTMQRVKGVVMARLRAGHARPLQGGVNELRAKARPTEYGKVGCRAACPQAAADVCVNEKPCGLCCRGRRPRRPAEGSRPLPTMQRIQGW